MERHVNVSGRRWINVSRCHAKRKAWGDFDFDLLHDFLYQDKDYEVAYLGNRSIAKPGDLEEWFEDFQTPAPSDPERGFRR